MSVVNIMELKNLQQQLKEKNRVYADASKNKRTINKEVHPDYIFESMKQTQITMDKQDL